MTTTFDHAVFEKVAQGIEQTANVEGDCLTPRLRLADDLGLGRFGRIKLCLYVEEMFSIEIPEEATERFDTIGDIVRYVSRRCRL